ncbi:hypothetical protein VE02_02229 [Pseudogymnoascus sp. 03VT05]|nr:hypothetical protein VE02_02229 [Pseudogymnoascus sp. 03VT05]
MEGIHTQVPAGQDDDSLGEISSSPPSSNSDDDATEEEYASLTGEFDLYVALAPNFSAIRVGDCARGFLASIRHMIQHESPGMPVIEQKLLESAVNLIFKDIFGMRAKRRLHILQKFHEPVEEGQPLLDQNIPDLMKPFLKYYFAWKFAKYLKGILFEILGFHFANAMYNAYKVLCRGYAAIIDFLASNGFTPTIRRRHNDLILEYLAKGLGLNEYIFKQDIRKMECISVLTDAFGRGIIVLLPQMTVDCLRAWNPNPSRIISLLDVSFVSQAKLVCKAAEESILEPMMWAAEFPELPTRPGCDSLSLLESFTPTGMGA